MFSWQSSLLEQIIQRIVFGWRICRNFLRRELLFDIVTIKAPGCTGTAEAAPEVFADAAVLQQVSVAELHLQDARSGVVADGAQLAGVDLFHFHHQVVPGRTVILITLHRH
jgi:hypothetical protein